MHWRRGPQTEVYNTAHYIGRKNHHRSCSYIRPQLSRKHTTKVILPSFPSTGFDTSISKLSCSCWPLKRLRCSCSIRLLSSSSRGCHVPSINHCPRITGIFSVSKNQTRGSLMLQITNWEQIKGKGNSVVFWWKSYTPSAGTPNKVTTTALRNTTSSHGAEGVWGWEGWTERCTFCKIYSGLSSNNSPTLMGLYSSVPSCPVFKMFPYTIWLIRTNGFEVIRMMQNEETKPHSLPWLHRALFPLGIALKITQFAYHLT